MALSLTSGPEALETGNGFDDLAPAEDLVSVIVPSYAHEAFVEEALRSIAAQTHRKIEIILIDDHSPDRTFARALAALRAGVLPYCAIRRRHAGMDTNLNTGILLARGNWISTLASDDAFPINSFEVLLQSARLESADVAVGSVQEMTRDGKFKGSRGGVVERFRMLSGDRLRKALLEEHGSLMIQGMLISRKVFTSVGIFTPELVASDFDFLIRMASRNVKFSFVGDTTAFHRDTRETLSHQHIQQSLQSHLAIARRHSRTFSEYRLGASTVLCESGLNYFHNHYYQHAALSLIGALALAPLNTLRILFRRAAGRLSRR
jgi:glycosyltransferase involved in cell wall biosynthesis